MQEVTQHVATCQPCQDKALQKDKAIIMFGELNRAGMASTLCCRCTGCLREFKFSTSSKVQGMTGGKCWETNLAAVWSQMSTGGGHAPLAETMAVLGVQTMSRQSFMSTERKICEWWRDLLDESMTLAGKEEKEIAIANNSYHQGVPAATVIVDGGWSKRTHKHSYNAKSGVAIIIRKATGKILYMGVRNKFCSICNQHPGEPPVHTCFRNWNGSSAAMETDIIVEGFKKCEQQHGITYTTFIGDRDSSVYSSLIEAVPWGYFIKKVECANHSLKCYRSALEKLVHDNPSYKGKGKLTESMRKRLTKAARCAIISRSNEKNQREAIIKLEKNLLNGPLHCFGYHNKYSIDFCTTAKELAQLTDQSITHISSGDDGNSSGSSYKMDTSNEEDISCSISTDISMDQQDDLEDVVMEMQQEWNDATDDTNLETVKNVPAATTTTPSDQEEAIICDVQRILGRLVGKASQLLGMLLQIF